MAVYGVYYALTQPVLKALVVETVAQEIRGRALGVYFFVTSVATLAASLITGELWKHYGASVPFYVSAGLAVASAGLLLISHVEMKSAEKKFRDANRASRSLMMRGPRVRITGTRFRRFQIRALPCRS